MTEQNLGLCRVRIFVKGSNGNRTSKEQFFEFQNPEKACEAFGLTPGNDFQKAYDKLRAYNGNRVQLVHITQIKREQAEKKRKKRKKAQKREKLAPVAQTGKPMRRLNLSVEEITREPVESSKNWKKAAEICRKQAKQAKRVNSSKPTEKSNKKLEKPAGLFSESIKVTKSKVAAKRAELENQYVPSTNNPQFKEYKGRNKRNKRGQVGTQTSFI